MALQHNSHSPSTGTASLDAQIELLAKHMATLQLYGTHPVVELKEDQVQMSFAWDNEELRKQYDEAKVHLGDLIAMRNRCLHG